MNAGEGTRNGPPVFGFLLFGGSLSGALIRDIRLANELSSRGFAVHVWWAMDRPRRSPLRSGIQEHWLLNGLRYNGGPVGRAGNEILGRVLSRVTKDKNRARALQKRPKRFERLMEGYMRVVAAGVENAEPAVVRRFARDLSAAGVTHMLPMLGAGCPWVVAAQAHVDHRVRYLVTFQGYELYINYARSAGCESQLLAQLVAAVEASDYPAVAVSEDYIQRVHEDIGVPLDKLRAIPPGVPEAEPFDRSSAPGLIAEGFADFQPDVPVISFLGRRDTEKGIDLMLYAAKILQRRGLKFQVIICGPTLFGTRYAHVCRQIAEDLRCPIMWRNEISNELRTALFVASHCIVYPSIHREPFGMVPVEAMAYGTPAVVPDFGGVAGAIQADGEVGGLHFRIWDSGDLADRIATLLEDREQWRALAEAGPRIARYYSIPNLADRILRHLGLPATP